MICFPHKNSDIGLFLRNDFEESFESHFTSRKYYNRSDKLEKLFSHLNENPEDFGFLQGRVRFQRIQLGENHTFDYVEIRQLSDFQSHESLLPHLDRVFEMENFDRENFGTIFSSTDRLSKETIPESR